MFLPRNWFLSSDVRGSTKLFVKPDLKKGIAMQGWSKPRVIAKYAGVSERTLRSWLRQGLRHSRMPSGYILLSYDAVDEFLKKYESSQDDVKEMVTDIMRGLKISNG